MFLSVHETDQGTNRFVADKFAFKIYIPDDRGSSVLAQVELTRTWKSFFLDTGNNIYVQAPDFQVPTQILSLHITFLVYSITSASRLE